MKKFKRKNILFSTDGILGYKEAVEKELKNFFNTVEYIESDMPSKKDRTFFFKVLRELSKKNKFIEKYYKEYIKKYSRFLLNKYENMEFDYFFVVAGREFSKEFIQELKQRNKKIKCILYLWDKFEYTTLKNSADEFDYIFSFDPEDCKKYGFIFRPIFYINECEKNTLEYSKRKYDIFYIGALREMKRYEYVEAIYKYSQRNKLSYFLKLFSKDEKDLNKEILTNEKISYIENRNLLKNSRVVLDLSLEKQSGLTIRVSEAIGSKVKVITTNKYIKDYDFYDKGNIFFIEKIEDFNFIPVDFFRTNFKEIPENICKRYTTKGFIEEIFNKIEYSIKEIKE